jgi:hypothetical protein
MACVASLAAAQGPGYYSSTKPKWGNRPLLPTEPSQPPPIPNSGRYSSPAASPSLRFRKEATATVPVTPTIGYEGPSTGFAVAQPPKTNNDLKGPAGNGGAFERKDSGEDGLTPLPLPDPAEMFRRDPETRFPDRIQQQRVKAGKQGKDAAGIPLPAQPDLGLNAMTLRAFPSSAIVIEPHYVCYGRLLFEDRNTERYGWSAGPLQPILSSINFGSNMSSLTYNIFSFPLQPYDSCAGLALPGDAVPYLLYPPGASLTGGLAQAGVTVALYAIFP